MDEINRQALVYAGKALAMAAEREASRGYFDAGAAYFVGQALDVLEANNYFALGGFALASLRTDLGVR